LPAAEASSLLAGGLGIFPVIPLISRRIKDPVNVTGESRNRHCDRGGGAVFDARDGSIAIETSTSREIDTTKVSVAKHF
jgi:hypothetical protein